jgi:hypothetical protein
MELTESQMQALKKMYQAKGDALEALMFDRLVQRGIDEEAARKAARECSNRIWRNGMASGAFAGVVLGSIFTPVVGGFAGSSLAVYVGWQTLLQSNACSEVREWDLQNAVKQLNSGF